MLRCVVFALGALAAAAGTTPTQVHIALAGQDANGNPNAMAVSWQTEDDTSSSIVRYGTSSGVYSLTAEGSSASYYETFHHHVVLPDLSPSTKYFYSISDGADGWSNEFFFVSAPAATSNFSFAVFADLGVDHGDSSINFLNSIKNDVSLIWHGGDVSYADDSFLHKGCAVKFCYEQVWDEYMNLVQPFASQIPYMTAPGNHEAECHDPACLFDKERREKLANFTAYNTRFRMPSAESGGALNMHFSFNYGPVHFISIDTETGYPGAAEETRYVLPCGGFEEQLSWLEADLQKANAERDIRPWIFAQGHHPMYQGSSINAEFQAAMEDLFYKYGVDIYFSGHVHSYERDYPVYRGEKDPNGYTNPAATTYLMIGGAGNDEMRDAQRRTMLEEKPVKPTGLRKGDERVIPQDPTPVEGQGKWRQVQADGDWTAVTDKEYFGIGKVTIVDESTLQFHYYRTTSGELHDTMTLTRDHSVYAKKFKNM